MNCSYCNSDMNYKNDKGEEVKIIATSISVQGFERYGVPDDARFICYPCQWKMLDWLAEQAGCKK